MATLDEDLRELILATVSDLVSNFVYYDRKEDGSLSRDNLRDAISSGEITIDEIVDMFRKKLIVGLGLS